MEKKWTFNKEFLSTFLAYKNIHMTAWTSVSGNLKSQKHDIYKTTFIFQSTNYVILITRHICILMIEVDTYLFLYFSIRVIILWYLPNDWT